MPGVTHQGSTARREAVWTWLCVLHAKCVVCVKGLGETYITLDRRLLLLLLLYLLLLLLPLLRFIKTETGQTGNFKSVDICNAGKNQERTWFIVESARRTIRTF